jgi:outer membrane protein insertion porin family
MTHHSGGYNSDVRRPLNAISGTRSVVVREMQCLMLSRFACSRFRVVLLSVILSAFTSTAAMAQIGVGSPQGKSTSKGATPPKRSPIEQSSYIDAGEDDLPKNPFQLDEPLVKVLIEGNMTIVQSEISKHIKTRPGRPVTQKQIKDDVDALVRTRWFASVEPILRQTDEGTILVFRVLERPIVRHVEYKGLRKVKQKVFDNLTQLKAGSPFDVSANRECCRRIEEYYHEKGFAFATVDLEKGNDRDDREVVFLIHEGPKVHVTAVKFDGNKEFIDGILKTKTRTKTRILWLFGGKYDPATIRDDIEGIKHYYHSLGYFDVKIQERLKFSDNKANVEFHYEIDEGVRYKIRNIEVVGYNVLSEEQIRDMMKVEAGTLYNAQELHKDVDTIKSKYGEQGRLFSQVDAVPRFTEEPGIVDIVYRINEDKVYRIRNIDVHIKGDHPNTKVGLVRNIAPLQPGDLADPKKIQMYKARLAQSGYFETGQENGVKVDAKRVEDTSWVAKPNYDAVRSQSGDNPDPLPTLNKATRPTTPPKAPPRNLIPNLAAPALPPSFGMSSWIGTEESRAESRDPNLSVTSHFEDFVRRPVLMAERPKPVKDDGLSPITPLFRAQSMDPLRPPQSFGFDAGPPDDPFRPFNGPENDWTQIPPEFTDLDVTVADGRTGKLMFGVGVNSNAGLVGNIVLSENNFDITKPPMSWNDVVNGRVFRGGGQKFRIEAQPGTQVSRYLVDWQDPYFLDSNFNLGVSGFYFLRYYRNWYEERVGGKIRLGRQLTQHWSANAALRLEDVDIYNPTTPSPQSLTNVLGYTLLSTVRGAIVHDTRDAAFNSGSGHFFELSYEQAFGQFNYPRIEAEARQYWTTYRRVDGQGKHTISVRGNVGWSGSNTPIYEHFFAGGFQNFRGFAFRGVSPVDTNVYVGGDFMALGSVEYMLPVTANEMVKVVGFSDFGTVNTGISLDDFRVSVGAGFRLSIPMMGPVPIAIDFAVPVMQQSSDIKQLVSFYIGMNR